MTAGDVAGLDGRGAVGWAPAVPWPARVPTDDLVPVPGRGRRYTTSRRVRLADADPAGRLRLDALARLLQDVGNDDLADAGLDVGAPWVARRVVVVGGPWPRLGERLTFTTFCGGLGGRWAERRSSVQGDGGGRVEVAALWVFLDAASGRPARLPDSFIATYAEAAGGRLVRARATHPRPPEGAATRPWPVRFADLDILGHVNNAASWQAVEEAMARAGVVPGRAELEYGAAVELDDAVELRTAPRDGRLGCWLTVGATVRASALVWPAG